MKWNSPHEFYLDVDGKSMWGGQCVHLFNGFTSEMCNGFQVGCTESGYAKDIWNQRYTNGVLNYYDEVPANQMVDGDWAIYDNCEFAPYSHVAMFRLDNGNNTGIFLQQNDTRHNPVTSTAQDTNPYAGIMGALRLKAWHEEPKKQEKPKEEPKKDDSFKVGDKVKVKELVDYNGTGLISYDDYYIITELVGDRAVLSADRDGELIVWSAVNINNLIKV